MKTIDKAAAAVTRKAIVQYAGVVQDFNPVHFDDEFARKAGLPGVIAQGPLTVTLVLDALVALHGADNIAAVKTRMKAPVVPGDQLHVRADEQGSLSVSVAGREVLTGTVQLKD